MSEKSTKYLDYVLDKQASFFSKAKPFVYPKASSMAGEATAKKGIGRTLKDALSIGAAASIPIIAINSWKKKIQNDTRRKALIEDLYQNDPIIKEADREEVLQYYATIFSVAPDISLDKNIVRELIQNFIKFGRVDVQTIKTLADTEKSINQSKSDGIKLTDALKMMG